MEGSYTYQAEVRWSGERNGLLSLAGKPELTVAPPPEFGGPTGLITPEDLFVSSAAACFLTTFLAMADRTRASFVRFSCSAEGVLEKVQGRGLVFTSIKLRPKVFIADQSEEHPVQRALDLTKKYCLVTNSMNCQVEMEPQVEVA